MDYKDQDLSENFLQNDANTGELLERKKKEIIYLQLSIGESQIFQLILFISVLMNLIDH